MYKVTPNKSVTLGDIEVSSAENGGLYVSFDPRQDAMLLSGEQADQLHEVLSDIMEWDHGKDVDDHG